MPTFLHRSHPPQSHLRGLRRRASLLLAVFLASLGALFVNPGAADDLGDKQNQRNQIGSVMDQIRAEIAVAQNQEAALQMVVAGLDIKIVATQQSMNVVQVKLDGINASLAEAQDRLVAVQAKLTSDKRALARQMVMVYKMGNAYTTLTNIVSATDFNEFADRVVSARHVADAENRLTLSVVAEAAEVQRMVDTINEEKASQQAVMGQLRDAAALLDEQRQAQQQARAHLAQVQANDLVRLKQAEQAAAELDQEIAALKAAQAAAAGHGGGNGHFSWPMSGEISQDFGCTSFAFEPYDASCATHHFHSGIDLVNSCGTPIHAADAGIAYTFYSSYGYGNHIIIVHGNGWSSVYGHMTSLAVGNTQGVARGQVIGYEGSTGNSTGCHVHFEVRLNEVPQNPLQYLP